MSDKISPMLQRHVIHFALIFLFAFTQIGVATHEISHLASAGQHTQQDQNSQPKHSTTEQCSQCIHYAKVANGLQLAAFEIPNTSNRPIVAAYDISSFKSRFSGIYSARAPPQISSI